MLLDTNSHSVFSLHYHLILVTKYRRQVFDDEVSDKAKANLSVLHQTIKLRSLSGIMIETMFIFYSKHTLKPKLASLLTPTNQQAVAC